ncbi:MAG: hypothetical protein WA971_14405 [Microbacterium sp.]
MDILTDADVIRIAGLPLHPLLVHATVVLTPLTALAVALTALWPAARRRLGPAPPIAAFLVALLVPATVITGQDLARLIGRNALVEHHEELGLLLVPWAIALLPAAVAAWAVDRLPPRMRRRRPRLIRLIRIVAPAAAVVTAMGTLVIVVLTGEAGARAVWQGV